MFFYFSQKRRNCFLLVLTWPLFSPERFQAEKNAQLLEFLWVWLIFTKGRATNLGGLVKSVADITDTPTSQPSVQNTLLKERERERG